MATMECCGKIIDELLMLWSTKVHMPIDYIIMASISHKTKQVYAWTRTFVNYMYDGQD